MRRPGGGIGAGAGMRPAGGIGAVLFDLDGTLLDTAPDMAAALNETRLEEHLAPLPFTTIRPHVSHGAAGLMRLGFPDVPEPRSGEIRRRFLELYRNRIAAETRLFAHMPELLAALERRAIAWGVVTNKPGWLTEPLLDALELRTRAGCIVCGDTFPERKPHPRQLLHAAELLRAAPDRCIYVGDAERDVRAARAAGMQALVARFGYIGPMDKIDEWPAHGWIDSPLEVLDWLEDAPTRAAAP